MLVEVTSGYLFQKQKLQLKLMQRGLLTMIEMPQQGLKFMMTKVTIMKWKETVGCLQR
jgi:hypothetical protein